MGKGVSKWDGKSIQETQNTVFSIHCFSCDVSISTKRNNTVDSDVEAFLLPHLRGAHLDEFVVLVLVVVGGVAPLDVHVRPRPEVRGSLLALRGARGGMDGGGRMRGFKGFNDQLHGLAYL